MEPLEIALGDDRHVAGVVDHGAGEATLLLLHEVGLDLDSLRRLARAIGFPEARKLVIDLPGHGLSSGEFDAEIAEESLLDLHRQLVDRAWVPLIVVAAGQAARFALRLAQLDEVIGVALLSPRRDPGDPDPDRVVHVPTFAVVPTRPEPAVQDWLAIRRNVRNRWLSASMAADHDDVVRVQGPFARQIGTHLQGFVREVHGLHVVLRRREHLRRTAPTSRNSP